MSYTEPEPAPSRRAARGCAWALVAVGAALFLFHLWFQGRMIEESRRYGLEASWLSLLPMFLPLGALIAGAVYAARRRAYGWSVAFGAVAVVVLGWLALLTLAGAGM
jgi:hypothetical protein